MNIEEVEKGRLEPRQNVWELPHPIHDFHPPTLPVPSRRDCSLVEKKKKT